MENYITLFDSITGNRITYCFNQTEIETIKQTPTYTLNSNELVTVIYKSLLSNTDGSPVTFTSALSYLLKSQTYKIGNAIGSNSYYIYVSSGNGDGFCRFCGSGVVKNVVEANEQSEKMIDFTMSMVGMNKPNPVGSGSNKTKPKKKRK